jgi:hypothetical protein
VLDSQLGAGAEDEGTHDTQESPQATQDLRLGNAAFMQDSLLNKYMAIGVLPAGISEDGHGRARAFKVQVRGPNNGPAIHLMYVDAYDIPRASLVRDVIKLILYSGEGAKLCGRNRASVGPLLFSSWTLDKDGPPFSRSERYLNLMQSIVQQCASAAADAKAAASQNAFSKVLRIVREKVATADMETNMMVSDADKAFIATLMGCVMH